MNLRRTLALLAVAVFYLGTSALAATRAVPSQYSTLRAALESATSGDVITIAPGIYQESGLVVPSGVTIEGTGAIPQDVMLDGEGQARLMLLEGVSQTTTIRNITFINGHAQGPSSYDQSGGALLISNSLARIENCIFSANTADSHGGAIRCNNSSPEIVASKFFVNFAPSGGGGALDLSYNSSPVITDCVFLGNRANWGGGLSCRGGSSPRVENAELSSNVAAGQQGFGGGVFADHQSSPDLLSTTVADNKARFGGAMASFPASPINLDYCTIVNNSATVLVGGILMVESDPWITGSIIVFNQGRGIGVSGSILPHITCTNIFGNSAGDWDIKLRELESSFDNLSIDPQFCSMSAGHGNRFHLNSSSPLADSGSPCGIMGAKPVSCDGDKDAFQVPVASASIERVMAAPNPFNPQTTVSFELALAQEVRVSIYGVDGRLIRVLGEGVFNPGFHDLVWNGTDQTGRNVSSGLYFAVVKGREETRRLKITLLK